MGWKGTDESGLSLRDYQLASGAASIAQKIVLHPVDTIKTRLQHLRLTSEVVFKDPAMHVVRFIRAEGLAGLYRGIVTSLIGAIPVSMVYMPSYEIAKRALPENMLPSLRYFCAGTVAGFIGSVVRTPVDLIKKRTQVGLYGSAWETIQATVGNGGGILALWGNLQASLLYDVPYNMVQFTILEQVKRAGRHMKRGEDLDGWENVAVGAATGILTSLFTEPLDVVKTRLMTKMGYANWLDAFTRTVREEGILALWKGTLPRMVWVAAGSALWYSVYENMRLHISRTKTNRLQNAQVRLNRKTSHRLRDDGSKRQVCLLA
mmetsp:Transcript_9160/g.27577  ORF Transcript_9160/g.27577 Transcript_9160/m.27577 type:complete len:319 (+) Transcript_9160:122-1078(+)